MNSFFLDASALAKRYTLEAGASLVDCLFDRVPRQRLMCLMLGAAEVVSVLVRRRNSGRLSPTLFAQGMHNFRAEVIEADDFTTLPVDDDLIDAALLLIERHSINATDSLVLRLCLDLADEVRRDGNNLVLVASDKRLTRAAADEGLVTFDPETQTQTDLDALLGP